ncbi:polyphosphate kinase [Aurantimonas sp. MSK8Z-1]|uniref:polyphosphate kinase 2 family protein n=1 Tax=Mangrovibrevibacter kandeliae TaxID=2968473 RepID=UPI002117881C|nr:polyphosphate kinase [Aurantimonas sp. MSK8Z-1]MCW4115796.1 polyphosphate kinase [Aurantimonas sp. MSK8Z-1]
MSKKKHAKDGRLGALDMSLSIHGKDYDKQLHKLQKRFQEIQQAYLLHGTKAVVVFEGWDAAGKGGTIRRMASVMDPRGFHVWPIAAPTPYYKKRHYLARFWDRIPADGEICVFDRSWYGRVLVERVEGFAKKDEWQRAYDEINEFERQLVDDGTRVAKVFLYITPDEQLERFEKRLDDPLKRWKLSYEDFRNREKWSDYETAANEMFEKTSTDAAPWLVVPSNSKKYGRITALTHIADRLAEGVDLAPRPLDEGLKAQFEALKEAK